MMMMCVDGGYSFWFANCFVKRQGKRGKRRKEKEREEKRRKEKKR